MDMPLNDEELNEDTELEIAIDDDEEVTPEVKAAKDKEDNPNVADQLAAAAPESTQTLEERYKVLQEADPELAEYHGKNVDKRIKKLTYKHREAERQAEDAMTYAQGVLQKNTELESKLVKQDGAFIGEHKTRLSSELERANQSYQDAYNLNDAEAIAKATGDIARVSTALANADHTETRFKRREEERKDVPAPTYAPAQPTQNVPKVDAKTEEWAERNEWWGEDKEVTNAAIVIHKQLVAEGMIPSSPGYFPAIDARLKKNFPDKDYWGKDVSTDNGSGTPTTVSAVTPVSASIAPRKGSKGKTVRLSASQRSVAKKLGITDQQYAKSVAEMEQR